MRCVFRVCFGVGDGGLIFDFFNRALRLRRASETERDRPASEWRVQRVHRGCAVPGCSRSGTEIYMHVDIYRQARSGVDIDRNAT